MVRFTRAMRAKEIAEWECFYVSYNSLKAFIKRDKSDKPSLESKFFKILVKEVDKAGDKYVCMKKEAVARTNNLLLVENPSIDSEQEAFDLSKLLRNLIKFACWNFNIVCHLLQRLQRAGVLNAKSKFLKMHEDQMAKLKCDEELSGILHKLENFLKKISPELDTNGQDEGSLRQSLLGTVAGQLGFSITNELIYAKDELIAFQNLTGAQIEKLYPDFFTLFLAVISSPLYFTNFYMLLLTGSAYSASVDTDKHFTGFLNGVNWLAIAACGVLYKYWTMKQFKIPITFSVLMVIFGNLLYFLAYDMQSPLYLLLGRLLLGIGNPRVINRRYIAKNVIPSARVSWSTSYLAGRILGVALGIFIATALYSVEGSFFGATVKGFNICALIMLFIWIIYFFLVIYGYKEPEIQAPIENKENGPNLISWIYVTLLLFLFSIPKCAQEVMYTSIPIVAEDHWNWPINYTGVYLGVISLAVAPIHIFIAYKAKYFEDRVVIIAAHIICYVSCYIMIPHHGMTTFQYIAGTLAVHISATMVDGYSLPFALKKLPAGTIERSLNAELVTSLVGSLLRAIGCLLVGLSPSLIIYSDF